MRRDEREALITRHTRMLARYVVDIPRHGPPPPPPEPPPRRSKAPKGPSDDAMLILRHLADHGPSLLSELTALLGNDRSRTYAAQKDLLKRGLIVTDTLGNKRKVHDLSENAKRIAEQRGRRIAKYKSGPGHEVLVRLTGTGLEQAIAGITLYRNGISRTLETDHEVQPDLLGVLRDGRRIAVQVSVHNKVPAEVKALLALASAVWKTVMVTATREKKVAIERALKQAGSPSNVEVVYVEEFLDEGFSWSTLLQLEER